MAKKETDTKAEAPKREEKKFDRKKRESFFYMGPTIRRGVLEKGMVFRGELPETVTELIGDKPALKALIVSKKEYVDATKDMRVKGSRMQALYKQAEKGGK